MVLGAALALLRSKVFRVFPLDDQIFRNVIWVLLHSHHRTFLKTGYSISSTSIRGKVWNANLRLLEEVDAFFDPLTELLLRFLTLSQIPFRQHLLHLGRKRMKFNFSFFLPTDVVTSQRDPRMVPRSFWYPGSITSYTLATSSAYFFTWGREEMFKMCFQWQVKSYPFQILIVKLCQDPRVKVDKMPLEHDHQIVMRVEQRCQLLVEDLELWQGAVLHFRHLHRKLVLSLIHLGEHMGMGILWHVEHDGLQVVIVIISFTCSAVISFPHLLHFQEADSTLGASERIHASASSQAWGNVVAFISDTYI